MRKRILVGVAALAAIATLGIAVSASGVVLSGTYAGKITGIEGNGNLGFRGGNMKFRISGQGRIKSFQFSKIRVACTDGNVYRTSERPRLRPQRRPQVQVQGPQRERGDAEGPRHLPRPQPRPRAAPLQGNDGDDRRRQEVHDVQAALVGEARSLATAS
jgi:hypothetical protein